MTSNPLLSAVVVLIIFSAGLIQGITGFGFVLVAAPLMTIFMNPQVVVPVIIVQALATTVPILLHAYRHLRIRHMWRMTLAGMVGVPIGTLVLLALDASFLRLLIGTIVTVTAVAMILGFRKHLDHELAASVPVGFISGIFSGSTGLSGPPVILFYTNQNLNTREFRANLVVYFMMLNVVTLPSFIIAKLFTGEMVLLCAKLLPVTLFGAIGGVFINRWVGDRLFRRIALVLISISGIIAAVAGIVEL